MTCSTAGFCGPDFCLIFASFDGYDEPEILSSQSPAICLKGADGGQDIAALRPNRWKLKFFGKINSLKGRLVFSAMKAEGQRRHPLL
jgi:hypothetical protein